MHVQLHIYEEQGPQYVKIKETETILACALLLSVKGFNRITNDAFFILHVLYLMNLGVQSPAVPISFLQFDNYIICVQGVVWVRIQYAATPKKQYSSDHLKKLAGKPINFYS